MIWIDLIQEKLAQRPPVLLPCEDRPQAAVAIVTCPGASGRGALLYILRAQREGDPWSGHIAFPGGRIDAGDAGPRDTAEREAREELGLDLGCARFVGRLDDLTTQFNRVHVAGFVYHIDRKPPIQPGSEVRSAFWLPLDDLVDPARRITTRITGEWGERAVAALDMLGAGSPVMWGLTYRFTAQVLSLTGVEIPGGSRNQIDDTITKCEV